MDKFQIQTEDVESIHVMRMTGGIDGSNAPAFSQTLQEALDAGKHRIICDFLNVLIIGSTAIGALMTCQQKLTQQDGEICLAGPDPRLMKVLKLVQINQYFRIFDSVEDALAALQS